MTKNNAKQYITLEDPTSKSHYVWARKPSSLGDGGIA